LWFRDDESRDSRATSREAERGGVRAVRSRIGVRHDTCDTAAGEGIAIADAATDDRKDGRLMLVHEPGAPGKARISGSLTGDRIRIVLDAIATGVAVLDLSEVDRVDDRAVRALAGLSPERCTLEDCPRWLSLWLERVRGAADDD
jgi:hypothetical protein